MSTSVKVLIGPKDTDFGIARLVVLPDGSGRGEVFDEGKRSWVPSSNPKLTVGVLSDALPVSPGLAARLGLADPDTDDASELPPAPPMSPSHKGPVGEELRRHVDEMVKLFLRNLNFNVLHDIDPDAPESERQAVYARLRNEELGWLNLPSVVRPDTLKAIEQNLSRRGWRIADRWAAGAPAMVRRMEAEGTLLARLKEQAALEAETIAKARASWPFSDTPDSELLAMYEIQVLPD